MVRSLKDCVALGVEDMREAADYYERVLGYTRRLESPAFIEMNTGELRVFLTHEEVTSPTFKIRVDDTQSICDYLAGQGFEKSGELTMRDPFGYVYCVVDADSEPAEDVFALIELK